MSEHIEPCEDTPKMREDDKWPRPKPAPGPDIDEAKVGLAHLYRDGGEPRE